MSDNSLANIYLCTVRVYTPNGVYQNNSFTFSLTMSLPTVTDPPTNLMETTASTTSTTVAFSWTPPVNDGGLAITGYEIQCD